MQQLPCSSLVNRSPLVLDDCMRRRFIVPHSGIFPAAGTLSALYATCYTI